MATAFILLANGTMAQENYISKCSRAEMNNKAIPSQVPTELQQKYDLKYYYFNLNVENTTTALSGDVTMRAQVVAPILDTFSFHLHHAYTIDSIKVNNVLSAFFTQAEERLIPNLNLPQGSMVDVQIFYGGEVANAAVSDWNNGIYTAAPYGCNVTYTLSCPFAAYGWYPTKHVLTDKIDSAEFHYTTTAPNKVAANGLLQGVDTLPDNKLCYKWKTNYPIDYYLIAFGVSDYREYNFDVAVNNSSDTVLVQNFIYNNNTFFQTSITQLEKVGTMLQYYSDTFCVYPFIAEKFGHLTAPIGGGMEHQTMVTLNNFETYLVAHEMAHQWFGDMVTCGSWSHIWLNEGFATYFGDYIMREHIAGSAAAENKLRNIRNNLIAYNTGSIYVSEGTTDFERIFSGTLTYNKGALLLHNLRFVLNDDAIFFDAIRLYLSRFAYKTAITADFQQAVEEVSGMDLDYFFDQWFYGEGYPVFDIHWSQDNENLTIFSRETTTSSVTPFFKTPYEIEVIYDDYSTERIRLNQTDSQQFFALTLSQNKPIIDLSFDPEMKLLAKGNFYYGMGLGDVPSAETDVQIFPNPARNEITLACSATIEKAEILNILGQKIYEMPINKTTTIIDISTLAKGKYIVKLYNNNAVLTKQFMVE
jgi:aminopeptidase N